MRVGTKNVRPILMGLFGPYLYGLLQNLLPVFLDRLGPMPPAPIRNGTKLGFTDLNPKDWVTGLICSSRCLRALRLARGVSFHTRPGPGNESLICSFSNFLQCVPSKYKKPYIYIID